MHAFRIFSTLLYHGWLSLRRSHHFERSLGVKFLMAFVGLTLAWNLYLAGMMLPQLLTYLFPSKEAPQAFFSLLLFLYSADFSVRFFFQKIPRQLVAAYMSLPVSRNSIASFILLRSWFSIYNFYLFFLLLPFFSHTLIKDHSSQTFWLAMLGCFLLGGVNHALIVWLKTWPDQKIRFSVLFLFFTGVGLISWLYTPTIMAFSEQLGLAFITGQPQVFILLAFMIILLQVLSLRGLALSFYDWAGTARTPVVRSNNPLERLLARIPVYGLYWELEWRLIFRNKRASGNLKQWPFIVVGLPLFLYFLPESNMATYLFLMVMIAGGYGFFHLQHAYSWESRFFDLIATSNIRMNLFIEAKYYFYCLLGFLKLIPLLILLAFFRPAMVLPMAGFFFYVAGALFAFMLYTGIGSSTRIDPNKKATFNFEGNSGAMFLTGLASIFSILILMIFAFFLPFPIEKGLALLTGGTGILFMIFHRSWIKAIALKFHKRKYHNLSKYREK